MKWGLAFPPAPTVPRRVSPSLGGEAVRFGLFRGAGQNRGFGFVLRSPSSACASSGFPAGSPSRPKPWRFAARQIRNRSSDPRHLVVGRSLGRKRQGPWPKPGFCLDSPWTCVPGLPFRSSRAEARSCPTVAEPKLAFHRWQRADFRPAPAGRSPGRSRDPVFGAKPEGLEPGRLTLPAT